ncbi:MAG: InlB B-repeat-containing protein [Brevefilum fermentans]|jgi:predicted outer membrane repeat protein
MKRKHSLFLCFVLLLLAFPASKPNVRAQGTHIFVSPEGAGTDCSQEAPCSAATGLGKADDGDTLYFEKGTYKGTTDPIFTLTKAVSLIGGWDGSTTIPYTINPRLYETVIDGGNMRRLLEIDFISNKVILISGITFRNGKAPGGLDFKGGAILVKDGGTRIESCRFENNSAQSYGGAIFVESDDRFEVKFNKFEGNHAGYGGGVLYISRKTDSPDAALIERNQLIENSTFQDGLIEVERSETIINANLIENTEAVDGILIRSNQKVKITNNIIYWTHLPVDSFSAISVYYEEGDPTEIIHNTIINARWGIKQEYDAKMVLTNNIIYGCTTSIDLTKGINLSGSHNLFYNNQADPFTLVNPITDQDPLFVNAAMQNYHLKKGSPAIDTGAVVSLTDDFDGDERPMGDGYDIGADEFDPDKLDLTVSIKPDGAGEVQADPPRPYHKGNNVTLTAVPNAGWVFRNWEVEVEGDTAYKVFDSEMEITMTDNTTVTAQFVKEYQLTVRVDPDEAGSIDIDHPGPYYADQEVMLTAVPNAGWSFSHWSGNASGDENPLEVTITGDTKVTAHFKRDSFEIFLPLIRR